MSRSGSRRDRTRPLELVGLAASFAVFVGGFVLLFTRLWVLALEFAGATFILALITLAMLMLAVKPDPGDVADAAPNGSAGAADARGPAGPERPRPSRP